MREVLNSQSQGNGWSKNPGVFLKLAQFCVCFTMFLSAGDSFGLSAKVNDDTDVPEFQWQLAGSSQLLIAQKLKLVVTSLVEIGMLVVQPACEGT